MSAMLASDEANPNFHGARNPDSALHVVFYKKPVKQPFKSQKDGIPVYESVVYVKIFTPGNQLNVIDTPARDDHKRRFPLQWAHFQNQDKGGDVVGIPVNQWPMIDVALAETLKALKFFTVEQVAFASDEQIAKLGMAAGMAPMVFRDRAKTYLEVAKDSTALAKERAEKDELKQRLEALEALVRAQGAPQVAAAVPVAGAELPTAAATAPNHERDELAKQYEEKFGKKPHHKMSAATIREKLGEPIEA